MRRDIRRNKTEMTHETHELFGPYACAAMLNITKFFSASMNQVYRSISGFKWYHAHRKRPVGISKIFCCYTHAFIFKLPNISSWNYILSSSHYLMYLPF